MGSWALSCAILLAPKHACRGPSIDFFSSIYQIVFSKLAAQAGQFFYDLPTMFVQAARFNRHLAGCVVRQLCDNPPSFLPDSASTSIPGRLKRTQRASPNVAAARQKLALQVRSRGEEEIKGQGSSANHGQRARCFNRWVVEARAMRPNCASPGAAARIPNLRIYTWADLLFMSLLKILPCQQAGYSSLSSRWTNSQFREDSFTSI